MIHDRANADRESLDSLRKTVGVGFCIFTGESMHYNVGSISFFSLRRERGLIKYSLTPAVTAACCMVAEATPVTAMIREGSRP